MNAPGRAGGMVPSALVALLALSAGGPGGGGGGGDTTGSVYSDLVIALRAENGTPILQKYAGPPAVIPKAPVGDGNSQFDAGVDRDPQLGPGDEREPPQGFRSDAVIWKG